MATREDYDAWQTEWNGYFAELLQALEKFCHRSSAPTPAWAEGLNAELKHAKFIVDFRGRDERFIARVRLIELALAGQVTEEEFGAAKLILNV
ncbi:MAG: hypothetical protein HOP09_15670 [Hyphomicrobium sp.]|nr:hypothetical protein [Hyphomicrobium sp.]